MKPVVEAKVSKLDKNTYFITKKVNSQEIWEGIIKFRLLEKDDKDSNKDVFIVVKEGYNLIMNEETESIKTLYRIELISFLNKNNLGDRIISI